MRKVFTSYCFGTAFFLLALSSEIHSQGISSNVGGLAASPVRSGPASVFWNPATIAPVQGTRLETNLSLLGGWLIFDKAGIDPLTGNPYPSSSTSLMAPNPFFSLVTPFGSERWRWGYATYFPAGAMGKFNPEGTQRYDLVNGLFLPWSHQFTLAYQPNPKLSFAASLVFSYAFFESELDVDMGRMLSNILQSESLGQEDQSVASRVKIPMSTDLALGGAFGILYRPNLQWSLGLSYHLPMNYRFRTELGLSRPSLFQGIDVASSSLGFPAMNRVAAEVEIEHPSFIAAGVRYQPFGYWTGEYFGRLIFSSLTHFTSVHFRDSNIARLDDLSLLGARRRNSYLVGTTQTFSLSRRTNFGVLSSFHWNGVDDRYLSTSRIDFDTLNAGLFVRYNWTSKWEVGLEYSHSFMLDRDVSGTGQPSSLDNDLIQNPVMDGKYRAASDRLGIQVQYAF